ncbi:MAG: glycoside hydrolase family 20 zincin-like fold domain-containing protein, partial [Alistipes sp.]|nr:glycoside hydrolase family 20 zincin-like fold domain-containing protein [Alistipes sp.]
MKAFELTLSVVLFAMAACTTPSEPRLNSSAEILPRPTKMVHHDGVFTIDANTTLCYDESVAKVADILCEYVPFAKRGGECNSENAVRLLLDNSLGKEAYTLTIDQSGVTIKGGDYGGVLYGMESLLQLLPYDVFTKGAKLPLAAQYVEIEDSPRFPFRGMMMDMSSDYYT